MNSKLAVILLMSTIFAGQAFCQENVPDKPSVQPITIVLQDPKQKPPVEKAVSNFKELQSGLGENFDEIKKTLPNLDGNELAKAIERLKRISEEMERLNARTKEFVEALNAGKPVPSIAKDANPEAYKDKNGKTDDELVNKLLEVGIAGICIYQPQYCAVAMLIAKALGLNMDNIRESTRALGALNDSVQAGKADSQAIDLIGKKIPGLDASDLKAIMNGDADPTQIATKVREAVKKEVESKIAAIARKFGVADDKVVSLRKTIVEGERTLNEVLKLNPWVDSPSEAERKAALELLSLLLSIETKKQSLIEQLQKRVEMQSGQ